MTTRGPSCSTCGGPRDRDGQRTCSTCHAEYQRIWKRERTTQFRKMSRATAFQAKTTGKIAPQPCQICGTPKADMHHPDHEMPHFVFWLCRAHHAAWHEHWKSTVLNAFAEWVHIARACAAVRKAEEMKPASEIPAPAVRAA